jgi:hypothetical protein
MGGRHDEGIAATAVALLIALAALVPFATSIAHGH